MYSVSYTSKAYTFIKFAVFRSTPEREILRLSPPPHQAITHPTASPTFEVPHAYRNTAEYPAPTCPYSWRRRTPRYPDVTTAQRRNAANCTKYICHHDCYKRCQPEAEPYQTDQSK